MKIFKLTQSEIWYIASQNAPAVVVGIPDPTIGMTTQELIKIGKKANKSLRTKGFIENGENGDRFSADVEIISYALSHPESSLILTIEEVPKLKEVIYFHSLGNWIVEVKNIDNCSYNVTIHPNKEIISQYFDAVIKDRVYICEDLDPICIRPDGFDRFIEFAKNGDCNKADALIEAGKESAQKFYQALMAPQFNLSLIAHLSRNDPSCQSVSGFGIFCGKDHLWELKYIKDGSSTYEIRPTTTIQIQRLLQEVLP